MEATRFKRKNLFSCAARPGFFCHPLKSAVHDFDNLKKNIGCFFKPIPGNGLEAMRQTWFPCYHLFTQKSNEVFLSSASKTGRAVIVPAATCQGEPLKV